MLVAYAKDMPLTLWDILSCKESSFSCLSRDGRASRTLWVKTKNNLIRSLFQSRYGHARRLKKWSYADQPKNSYKDGGRFVNDGRRGLGWRKNLLRPLFPMKRYHDFPVDCVACVENQSVPWAKLSYNHMRNAWEKPACLVAAIFLTLKVELI